LLLVIDISFPLTLGINSARYSLEYNSLFVYRSSHLNFLDLSIADTYVIWYSGCEFQSFRIYYDPGNRFDSSVGPTSTIIIWIFQFHYDRPDTCSYTYLCNIRFILSISCCLRLLIFFPIHFIGLCVFYSYCSLSRSFLQSRLFPMHFYKMLLTILFGSSEQISNLPLASTIL